MAAPPTLFIPEQAAIAVPRESQHGFFINGPWLALVRQIADLIRRISSTGTRNGIVVTDDEGVAQVINGEMDTPGYDPGSFDAVGGTWTVDAADVVTYAYATLGRMMKVAFWIEQTSVAGGPTALRILIPQGRLAAKHVRVLCELVDDGATPEVGRATVLEDGATIAIERLDGSAFSDATDTTDVKGFIEFEVHPLP